MAGHWIAAHGWPGVHELYAGARLAESLAQHGEMDDVRAVLTATDTAAHEIGLRALREQLAAVARRYRIPAAPVNADGPMTARELDVLALIAAGRTNAEIAEELYVSASTVRVHTSNFLRTLRVTTRTQATAVAYRRGLLPFIST